MSKLVTSIHTGHRSSVSMDANHRHQQNPTNSNPDGSSSTCTHDEDEDDHDFFLHLHVTYPTHEKLANPKRKIRIAFPTESRSLSLDFGTPSD